MKNAILAYDVGTSSAKATLFDEHGNILASASQSYTTNHPVSGWVEQNPHDWWSCVVKSSQDLMMQPVACGVSVAAIGCNGHM